MLTDTYLFVVWSRRNAESVFGAASNPVMRNGKLLCFRSEAKALAERDRLTCRAGQPHVRYSVRAIHLQLKPPRLTAEAATPAPPRPMPVPKAA